MPQEKKKTIGQKAARETERQRQKQGSRGADGH